MVGGNKMVSKDDAKCSQLRTLVILLVLKNGIESFAGVTLVV